MSRSPKCTCLWILASAVVAATAVAAPPVSAQEVARQLIVRASSIDRVAAEHGLSVLGELSGDGAQLYLVAAASAAEAERLASQLPAEREVAAAEAATLAALPGTRDEDTVWLNPSEGEVLADLVQVGTYSTPCLDRHFSTPLWSGYAAQRATARIRLHEAHAETEHCGSGVIATIDTGVDPDHPLLVDALVEGYDFILEAAGIPSEWSSVEQSVRPIVEQSVRPIVEDSMIATLDGEGALVLEDASVTPIVEQSVRPIVEEQPLPPAFGHGTMVAGILRLAAPGARIMPLRVFNQDGTAHLFDILRAIHFAVDHGARVVNMSFSIDQFSQELLEAMEYARRRGVVCVAAAGNRGERTLVYPAAMTAAVGVASTTVDDTLSSFSNFGAELAHLGAPGSAITSAFPGGLMAVGWGTSFSTPFVSGAVALFADLYPGVSPSAFHGQTGALSGGAEDVSALLGALRHGRLDALASRLYAEADAGGE